MNNTDADKAAEEHAKKVWNPPNPEDFIHTRKAQRTIEDFKSGVTWQSSKEDVFPDSDMTVQEFYSGFNLDFLTKEERQTIYTATELYANGKLRQAGKEDVCRTALDYQNRGNEGLIKRTYFRYDIKCECHSPNHFEIVFHCADCIPKEPTETKIIIKTNNLCRL